MSEHLREWWLQPARPEAPPPSPPLAHAGLWLDRCLSPLHADQAEKPSRKWLYRSAIEQCQPGGAAVKVWEARHEAVLKALTQPGPNRAVTTLDVQTTGRMLLHPGANSTVTDGTVLLHHTWGVPYLPGSGLKGLARAQARLCGMNDVDEVRLFGNERGAPEDSAGYVNFLDALWLPVAPANEPRWSPLDLDVVTPHHSAYYTEGEPAGDWEEPVPTQRLVISEGTRFRIILEGALAPAEDLQPWLDLAKELVVGGLTGLGFSAWTRAGYGQLEELGDDGRPVPRRVKAAAATVSRIWAEGSLTLNTGKRELTAVLQDGKKATARGKEVGTLPSGLPEAALTLLSKGKAVKVRVEIEPDGRAFRITDIKQLER